MAKVVFPPGFGFYPTDDELVLHYLLPRVTNKPLPIQGMIQDCDFYVDKHPWEIFKGQKIEKTGYFFTKLKKKTLKAKFAIRTVGDKVNGVGRWKLQLGTDIKDDKGSVIGKKNSLSYLCEEKCGYGTELGRWTMNEYSLHGFLSGSALPDLRDIVLCCITNHQDNKRKENQEAEFEATSSTVYDQEPTHHEPTTMDFPVDTEVYIPATDFQISQQQQQEDLGLQGYNGFAMGDECDMNGEANMEGHGASSHEEALSFGPFFFADDGFGVTHFQEQNTHQEPDIEHQVPTQEEQEAYNLNYFSEISLDDIEVLPDINGLPDPGGPIYVDRLESEYIPAVQEMGKADDKKDQKRQEFKITNTMRPSPVQNQASTQAEEVHVGDSSEALLQCSFSDIPKPSVAQEPDIEYQKPTQQEQQALPDMDYFSEILLDDNVDLPDINEQRGSIYVAGFDSIYIPAVQEMGKADNEKDQNRQEFEITNTMRPLSVQNQVSTQPEEAHVGDCSEAILQSSFGDIQKSSFAQEPMHQEQQDYDLDYFLGISLDDIVDLPDDNVLADPGGPLYVDGIESIYMPDLQEMGKTDNKKDKSRKRTHVFDQDDDD